jgi:hypothetical protein
MTSEAIVNNLLDSIRAIEDPAERFKAATETVEAARNLLMAGGRQIRQQVVNDYRSEGKSLAEIGELLDQTRSRIQQISEGRTGGKPKPE